MSGTLAELLAWPDREIIILAELTPSIRLRGWTAVGATAPNCYQIALPRFVATDKIAGGLYRRCVGFRINGTDYTERSSLALVNSFSSSWYWDEAAGILYVRTSTTSDPDLFTVAHAFVTFYLATSPVILERVDGDPSTAIYYQPWLMPETAASAVSQLDDFAFGAKSSAMGDLSVVNGHGAWFELLASDGDYAWKHKTASFLIGGRYRDLELTRAEYAAEATLQIEDASANESKAVFSLAPSTRRLNIQLPPTPYFEGSYPNLGEGVRGTRKWIGYGRTTMRPDLTDTTSHGVYTIADATYMTTHGDGLSAVHAVSAIAKTTGVRTALASGVDYSADLVACTLTILNASYAWQNYEIEVDVTGKADSVGAPIVTFADIVMDILRTGLGMTATGTAALSRIFDLDAFDQANIDAPEELTVWLKNPRTIGSIFATAEEGQASLERSVMGSIKQTIAGKWTVEIFSPGYDAADDIVELSKEDFKVFNPQPKLESVYATTRVFYNPNPSRDEWSHEEDTDPATQYFQETEDRIDLYTFLRDQASAQLLAARMQFSNGRTAVEVEFEERGSKLAQRQAGDKVLVTYAPAPSVAGAWSSKLFQLRRLEKRYAATIGIAGRLDDQRGIGQLFGRWMDSSAPDWASSTTEERGRSGYWTDSAGLPDPGDPSSGGVSLWW